MKLTDKYYVDKDGDMVRSLRHRNRNNVEVLAEPFHAKLKIVSVASLNSGCYFELQDENGKIYKMNDVMLGEYIAQKDVFLEGDWKFYKQGIAYSIGI
jgi:hypothetical protein